MNKKKQLFDFEGSELFLSAQDVPVLQTLLLALSGAYVNKFLLGPDQN